MSENEKMFMQNLENVTRSIDAKSQQEVAHFLKEYVAKVRLFLTLTMGTLVYLRYQCLLEYITEA